MWNRTPLRLRFEWQTALGPGCMEWRGCFQLNGYGYLNKDGRKIRAHRAAYELFVGPIPSGMHLDHLCRNRACVNVTHLEAVTCRVNLLRGTGPTATRANQAQCKRGHSFDEPNTYYRPNGTRCCRVCRAMRKRKLKVNP